MKKIAEIISTVALLALVAAPILFYAGSVSLQANKNIMLAATIVWFSSALCWIGRMQEN